MHRCAVCQKSFPSPYKLRRHQVVHTGRKPYMCKVCGKAFTQTVHLKTHLLNVHDSQIPGVSQPGGNLANDQKKPNWEKPAAGVIGNCSTMPSTVFSTAFSQPEWKRGTVTHKSCIPLSETGNRRTHVAHVNDGLVTQSSISCDMDPVHQDQGDSANMDASICSSRKGFTCKVCLKSFSSSLQLWIHSPIHNKSKSIERGQTSKLKMNLKKCLQPQNLRSSYKTKLAQRHQCSTCFKTFCSPSKLQRHFLTHTGQKPYSCTVCRKTFTQKVHLKSHLENGCPLSGVNAESRHNQKNSNLQTRLSLQDPSSHLNSSVELKLQCKTSGNSVNDLNKSDIKLDVVVKPEQPLITSSNGQDVCGRSGEQEFTKKDMKPFQCMSCNKSFRLEVNLIRHCKIHQNCKELGRSVQTRSMTNSNDVEICDSEAKRRVAEGSHADRTDSSIFVEPESWRELWDDSSSQDALATKRRRKGCSTTTSNQINTSHQCYMCSKCFPSGSKLQRHILTHTGQRPFHCEICGKRFQQKTHLRVHSRTHLWSRYQKQRSLYINRPPSRTGGLDERVAADVPNNKMLVPKKEIETCTAVQIDQISSIVAQNNGERESRNKIFPHTFNKNETLHFRKVSKVNVKSTQMSESMQYPGNVRHKCFHCFKCFQSASKLQRHELVHTGLKPFPCPKCGRAFGQTSHLKRHKRTRCNRKLSKPVNRQVNIKKLKTSCQQQLYPRITVSVPTPQQSANTSAMSSVFNSVVSKRGKTNSPKTNSKSKTKKLHTCGICCKNFPSSYKLSRHLVTHSGLRPFKCARCGKTFTQRCHLKVHEHRCRQESRTSHQTHRVIKNVTHLRNKCIDNLTDNTDFSVRAVGQQMESCYSRVGDVSCITEAIDTTWLSVGFKEDIESGSLNETTIGYNQATDHCSNSFPSEFDREMNNLIQNQAISGAAMLYQQKGNMHNVEIPCHKNTTAVLDKNKVLRAYWCEPSTVFECGKCAVNLTSEQDLKKHLCAAPKLTTSALKYQCDICFKHFVSPSKLNRHYNVHTRQRPF
ncbi:zinc finger protein 770-like [Solea solea]|uniref:zinc finger protein 770-like n=1 Tax=Solea solea TaxID=90069 RepID=UPI00272A2380|nr:zinc finger protein 770-like [Solea solea]